MENLPAVIVDGLWSGLLALAVGIFCSAPISGLLPSFCGGIIARIALDELMGAGAGRPLATAIAAAAVVIVLAPLVRYCRPGVSPIVILSSFVPLGASKSFFAVIDVSLRMPSLKGEALAAAAASLISNGSTVFWTTLAIALGASAGAALLQSVAFFRTNAASAEGSVLS